MQPATGGLVLGLTLGAAVLMCICCAVVCAVLVWRRRHKKGGKDGAVTAITTPPPPLISTRRVDAAQPRGFASKHAKHARVRYAFSAAIAVAPRLPATVTEVTEATEEGDDEEERGEMARHGGWHYRQRITSDASAEGRGRTFSDAAPCPPAALGPAASVPLHFGLGLHAEAGRRLAADVAHSQGGSEALVQIDSHRASEEAAAGYGPQRIEPLAVAGGLVQSPDQRLLPSNLALETTSSGVSPAFPASAAGPDAQPLPLCDLSPLPLSSITPTPPFPSFALSAPSSPPASQHGISRKMPPIDGALSGAARPVSQRSLVRTVRSRGTMGGQTRKGVAAGCIQHMVDVADATAPVLEDAEDWDGGEDVISSRSRRPSAQSVEEQIGGAGNEARRCTGGDARAGWRVGVVRGTADFAEPAVLSRLTSSHRPISPPVIEALHDFFDELLQETPREAEEGEEGEFVRRATPPLGVQLSVGRMRLTLPVPPASQRGEIEAAPPPGDQSRSLADEGRGLLPPARAAPHDAGTVPPSSDVLWSLLNGLLQEGADEARPPPAPPTAAPSILPTSATASTGAGAPTSPLLRRSASSNGTSREGGSPRAREAWGDSEVSPPEQRTSVLASPGRVRRQHSRSTGHLLSRSASPDPPMTSTDGRLNPRGRAGTGALGSAGGARGTKEKEEAAASPFPIRHDQRLARVREWLLAGAADPWVGSSELNIIPPAAPLPTPKHATSPAWATARGPLARSRPHGGRGAVPWVDQLSGVDSGWEEGESFFDDGEDEEDDWHAQAGLGQLNRRPDNSAAAAAPRFMRPTLSRRFLLHQQHLEVEGQRPAAGGSPSARASAATSMGGRSLRATHSTPALLPLASSRDEAATRRRVPLTGTLGERARSGGLLRLPRRGGIQFVDWLGSLREEGEWGDPSRRLHR